MCINLSPNLIVNGLGQGKILHGFLNPVCGFVRVFPPSDSGNVDSMGMCSTLFTSAELRKTLTQLWKPWPIQFDDIHIQTGDFSWQGWFYWKVMHFVSSGFVYRNGIIFLLWHQIRRDLSENMASRIPQNSMVDDNFFILVPMKSPPYC